MQPAGMELCKSSLPLKRSKTFGSVLALSYLSSVQHDKASAINTSCAGNSGQGSSEQAAHLLRDQRLKSPQAVTRAN